MGKKKTRQEKVLEQLAALTDETSRVKFLVHHQRLLSPAIVVRLDETVGTVVRKDLRQAQNLSEAALMIARRLGDKESLAYADRARANALWFAGQNRQAAHLHAQAIQLFEEMGNLLEMARTLSSSIQPLILLGEYDRALKAAEQARKIFSTSNDPMRLARLEINIGNIFHRQDRLPEALEYYERAVQQLAPDKDPEGLIAAWHNIAVCLIMLNDYERALDAYERVRAFCQQQNLPLAAAQADYNIAYLYYFRGGYGRAIEMLRATRETCERVGDPYHAALCRLDLSEIYLELNMSPEAGEMAQEARDRFHVLGMDYETAKALCNSAIALSQQGKSFQALDLFSQARAMFLKEQNQVWPFQINLYQALVFFNEGRLFEARRYCQDALEFFGRYSLPGKAILCRLLLARLSLKTREIEAAREQCRKVLEDLTRREAPILSYLAHLVMGHIEEAASNLDAARLQYRTAKEVLETLRGRVRGEELKISFMRNRNEVYENLVHLCLASHSTPEARQEAWTYMEQAKSRSLLDLMSHQVSAAADDEPGRSDLVRRIRTLRENLNWYYHRIEVEQLGQAPASDRRLIELREQAEQHEKDFLRVLRELPSAEAAAAGVPAAEPVSLENIRQALGEQATLVEYFRVRDQMLAAVVTHDHLEIVPVTLVTRIAQVLRMLQFQLSKCRLGPNYVREFEKTLLEGSRSHLRDLYNELVAEIRPRFKGQHLVVVPHGLLYYVPFHALYDGERYLIDSFTLSYAPSASIYAECHQKPAGFAESSLILGVPDPQTPSIYEELQSVAMMLPNAEFFLGSNASIKVLKEKGSQSRLIHIATHGFLRNDNSMFSGIRLGDTFMTVYDLYSLKLPADLITLSGCSTGLNVVATGDELLGLVRGLLAAGARTLLLTQWDVNDSSTAQFMKAFYSRLYNSPDQGTALREAMRELRESYPHPYYWAPFVLIGKVFPS